MEFKKLDGNKPDMTLLPLKSLEGVVKVLEFGANKYGRDNWKKAGDKDTNRFLSAALRHLAEVVEGNNIDYESGLLHIDHALCNLIFLTHFSRGNNG